MGRGTGAQALKDQTARQKGFTDTASKEEQQTFGTVTGADKDIIANPVSEAEKQARTQAHCNLLPSPLTHHHKRQGI